MLVFGLNILGANDNTVKTSELELFLFKIGFESLLKDVDINKDKSSLNESEIKNINEKIELIMRELYKDNRILLNDSGKKDTLSSIGNEDLEDLKIQVSFLKEEILKLKENKEFIYNEKKEKKEKASLSIKLDEMRVVSNSANIYSSSFSEAKIIRNIRRNEIVLIEKCDKFSWCKIKNKNEYIKRFLLK
jgi:hypothetical protein